MFSGRGRGEGQLDMSRRSSGLVGVWAEAQRQQQRQREAQQRAAVQEERRQRAYERDLARTQREQQAAYRQGREADARLRTQELEQQVAELGALLAQGCRAAPFRVAALTRPEAVAPFEPGQLAQPVAMPDPALYQAQGGWTAGRRAQAQQEAQARYRQDWEPRRPPRRIAYANSPPTGRSTTPGPPGSSPRYAPTTPGSPSWWTRCGPANPRRPSTTSRPPCTRRVPGPRGSRAR